MKNKTKTKMIIVNVEIPVDLKLRSKINALEKQITFKQFIIEAMEAKIKED